MRTLGSGMVEQCHQIRPNPSRSTRLVYIPTHRLCRNVITAVANEIEMTSNWMDDDFQLLVLDDRPAVESEPNRRHLITVAEEHEYPVIWISRTAWRDFLSAVLGNAELNSGDAALARSALDKGTGSYSGGPNKAAMLAAYLDAKTLHRRDSDEVPTTDANSLASTLRIECAILDSDFQSSCGKPPRVPMFAGTSVDGEPTRDHRDLAEADAGLVRQLLALTSRRGMMAADNHQDSPPEDDVELTIAQVPVHEDQIGEAEVGISATRLVHEWLPEMPAKAMIGTDYFQKGLLHQLELPVVWHGLRGDHRYDIQRRAQSDLDQVSRYAQAELRFACLKLFWNHANVRISANAQKILVGHETFSAEQYVTAFESAMRMADNEATATLSRFIELYAIGAERTQGPLRERLEARVQAMRSIRHDVVPFVRAAVQEHLSLVAIWSRVISSCRSL